MPIRTAWRATSAPSSDGVTSAGVIATVPTGGFSVTGTRTFVEDGNVTALVTISDVGGAQAIANATINVADPAIVGTGIALAGIEKTALTNVNVATFTHANAVEPANTFTASINWGDGGSSAGAVTLAS